MLVEKQRWRTRRPRANRPLRVLIADDDRILLDALASVLVAEGYQVAGSAENGRRAVDLARQRRPHVAVIDFSMPVTGGLDAARQILHATPRTAVLLLTGHADDRVVHQALQVGVRGFFVKAQGLVDLLQAIRDVGQGAIYVSPVYSRGVLAAFARDGARDPSLLTSREEQMLCLISDGKTMKQAAVVMAISVRTAECHRAHIMHKLGIHDTAGLVRYAIRQGLVVA
jgi:DNA-binding NarL/FixJ family response regulator